MTTIHQQQTGAMEQQHLEIAKAGAENEMSGKKKRWICRGSQTIGLASSFLGQSFFKTKECAIMAPTALSVFRLTLDVKNSHFQLN